MTDQPLPPLKQMIDAVQIEHDGKPMILLRDQEGINQQAMVISPAGFFVALMLDGRNTASDIKNLFAKNTGTMLDDKEIESIVQEFDRAHLLETENLHKKRKEILNNFLQDPIRVPLHLDGFAADDKLKAAAQLGQFFTDPKGPGKQFSTSASGAPLLGMVSPHIDFHRGGPAYAWAYQALSETTPPDAIVAFGVAHISPNSPWIMTEKAYATPYGNMTVHPELFEELSGTLWYNSKVDEWAHRTEHSLEFQAFWLRYLWRDKTPPWVPILCSSFERFCDDRAPSKIPSVETAIQKMADVLTQRQARGEKIMILAGIDLAHVGPRFGDQEALTPEIRAKIEKEDRVSLEHALQGDADSFYLSLIADGHWRKACGLTALYMSLRMISALQGTKKSAGELLTYGQADDPLGGVVSFASAAWKR